MKRASSATGKALTNRQSSFPDPPEKLLPVFPVNGQAVDLIFTDVLFKISSFVVVAAVEQFAADHVELQRERVIGVLDRAFAL